MVTPPDQVATDADQVTLRPHLDWEIMGAAVMAWEELDTTRLITD